MTISQEKLRSLLIYEPETGVFRWRHDAGRHGRFPAGSIAGWVSGNGYRYLRIDRKTYRASRLVWLYMNGVMPPHQVDHINRVTTDDRIANLRLAKPSQNKANSSLYRNNTSGFKGVYFDSERGDWRAKARVNGKRRWIGRFKTREQAFAAYCSAVDREYGAFANPVRQSA